MNKSIQKILERVRAPRVKISYIVDTNGAQEKIELPFVAGVIADVFGTKNAQDYLPYKEREFSFIDRDNFSTILSIIKPEISCAIIDYESDAPIDKATERKKISMVFYFNSIDDFHPDALIQQNDVLRSLHNIRLSFINTAAKVDTNSHWSEAVLTFLTNSDLMDEAIVQLNNRYSFSLDFKKVSDKLRLFFDSYGLTMNDSFYSAFCNLALCIRKNKIDLSNFYDAYSIIMVCLRQIHAILANFLDAILHNSNFQKLEATWRGIHHFISHSETGHSLKIRLFPCTFKEMNDDLIKASEFDQSVLFKKLYENEYGIYGGNPYSVLLVDWGATNSSQDVTFLRELIKVCAAAHLPCFTAAKPQLFDLNHYKDLSQVRDVAKIFESSNSVEWNSLRDEPDSRYLGLLLPSVMMRAVFSPSNNPIQSFPYEEGYNGEGFEDFCWGNPIYAMGERITESFSSYGWVSAIRGVSGGGLVENMPVFSFNSVRGDLLLKSPVEVFITDRREKELSDLGFITLCAKKQSNQAVFFSGQSIQKPIAYIDHQATENAALSARIVYLLNASRFAHYIKVMMRDLIGSFESAQSIETFLSNWVSQYVLLNEAPSQELAAEYPLKGFSLSVLPVEGKAGEYDVFLKLQPHLQLEALQVDISLVTRIGDA